MKYFTLWVLLLMFFFRLETQLKNQRALSLSGGWENNGLLIRADYARYVNQGQFIRGGLQLNVENYEAAYFEIPAEQYLGYIEYYPVVVSLNRRNTSFIYAGGGVIGGLEYVHAHKSTYTGGDAHTEWIYGATAGVELDHHLGSSGKSYHYKDYYLFVAGRYNYYHNSQIGEFQSAFNAGIKIVF